MCKPWRRFESAIKTQTVANLCQFPVKTIKYQVTQMYRGKKSSPFPQRKPPICELKMTEFVLKIPIGSVRWPWIINPLPSHRPRAFMPIQISHHNLCHCKPFLIFQWHSRFLWVNSLSVADSISSGRPFSLFYVTSLGNARVSAAGSWADYPSSPHEGYLYFDGHHWYHPP